MAAPSLLFQASDELMCYYNHARSEVTLSATPIIGGTQSLFGPIVTVAHGSSIRDSRHPEIGEGLVGSTWFWNWGRKGKKRCQRRS